MKKKANKGGAQESLDFIIKHMVVKSDIANMAMKDDVRDIVREEITTAIKDQDVATKTDIQGIVSSAHNRLDQELTERKKLQVRVTKLEALSR